MSQDPWKKAHRMSRGKGLPRQAGGKPQRKRGPASVPMVLVFLVLLPLLVGIGMFWFAWQNRGSLLPQYSDELPDPIRRSIAIPARTVDLVSLDEGLGIGLAIFGSQSEVIRSTRDWGVEWELTTIGSGRVRLETTGLRFSAANDIIESWEMDLDDVFTSGQWDPWISQLRAANVEQQLNLREVQGLEELPRGKAVLEMIGPNLVQYDGNYRHPAYELEFENGWLEEIRAGMRIGTATDDASAPQG